MYLFSAFENSAIYLRDLEISALEISALEITVFEFCSF